MKLFRAALARAQADKKPLVTWVCYCSVYGKCWAGSDQPKETKSCHADSARTFLE